MSPDQVSALEVLRSHPILGKLDSEDLQAVDFAMAVEEHADGALLIEEDRRGDSVYLLLSGEVVVSHGNGALIQRMQRGELFGLVALLENQRRSATCRAAGPVTVGVLRHSAFSLLFQAHAPVAIAFQRALASQLADDLLNLDDLVRAQLSRSR